MHLMYAADSATDLHCAISLEETGCTVFCLGHALGGKGAYHHGSFGFLGGDFQLGLKRNELLLHVCHAALCSGKLVQTHLIPLPHCHYLHSQCSDTDLLLTFAKTTFMM